MIILETDRLLFREHEEGDLTSFCDMQADAEVRRFVGGAPLAPEVAKRRFRERFLVPKADRLAMWATIYKPEGRYIGQCGVYPRFGTLGPIEGEGTLGIYLARPYWGRGLATEAGRAFVNFGFKQLGLSRIVSVVETGNSASLRIMEKLGFTLVRTEINPGRSYHHFELLQET